MIDDNNSKWQLSCLAIGNELMLVFALSRVHSAAGQGHVVFTGPTFSSSHFDKEVVNLKQNIALYAHHSP